MVEELDGVTHARRIFVRRGGDKIATNTIVLTFDSPKPPATIEAGYLHLKVTPYIPSPMRCFQCQRFGHTKNNCKKSAACCRCGKRGHEAKDCTADPSCLNCRGDHAADSKECPKWLEEKAILRYRSEHGGTFAQARAAVVIDLPRQIRGRTFANAARSGSNAKPTAPLRADGKGNTSAQSQREKAYKDSPAQSRKPSTPQTAAESSQAAPSKVRAVPPTSKPAPREIVTFNSYDLLEGLETENTTIFGDPLGALASGSQEPQSPLPPSQVDREGVDPPDQPVHPEPGTPASECPPSQLPNPNPSPAGAPLDPDVASGCEGSPAPSKIPLAPGAKKAPGSKGKKTIIKGLVSDPVGGFPGEKS